MTHRTFVTAMMLMVALPLLAFDLVVPSPGDGSYTLLEGDEEFVVDDSVFYKRVFDSRLLVERYTSGITMLRWDDDDELIVLLDAGEEELDQLMHSLYMTSDEPDMLIVNSPVTMDLIEELEVDRIYHLGQMTNIMRAMLRRGGYDFVELGEGSILQIDGESIIVISGASSQGMYIECPTCGTMIFIAGV